ELRRAQHQPSLITPKCQPGSELQYANHLPRAFLLLDVRGRLSRVENSGRRINRSTQFSFRKICERRSGTRTDEAAISRARSVRCHPRALSREINLRSGVHGPAGRETSRAKSEGA